MTIITAKRNAKVIVLNHAFCNAKLPITKVSHLEAFHWTSASLFAPFLRNFKILSIRKSGLAKNSISFYDSGS